MFLYDKCTCIYIYGMLLNSIFFVMMESVPLSEGSKIICLCLSVYLFTIPVMFKYAFDFLEKKFSSILIPLIKMLIKTVMYVYIWIGNIQLNVNFMVMFLLIRIVVFFPDELLIFTILKATKWLFLNLKSYSNTLDCVDFFFFCLLLWLLLEYVDDLKNIYLSGNLFLF